MKRMSAGQVPRISVATLAVVLLMWGGFVGNPAQANHSNQRLEVSPESESNVQGSEHTLTATLYQGSTDSTGSATSGSGPVVVDFAVESGPNAGESLSCTILTGRSSCSVDYDGDEGVGTDTIRASIRGHDVDESEGRYAGPTDCPNPPDPNDPNSESPGQESDCPEGDAEPGSTPEGQADSTDVVEKHWTQSVSEEVCIDVEPNEEVNASGSTHQIELVATDGRKITDTAGEFDCSGDPRTGILVDLELTDDEPNAFFDSVNGVSTGPSGGGPNEVTCTTDNAGACEATLKTVSSSAEGTNAVTAVIRGEAPDDVFTSDNQETVEKTWQRAGELATIDGSPEADTNEVGDEHLVTAEALDQFGNPVSGVEISFQVTSGAHSGEDLDDDNNTPDGYFGQCTTGDDGRCAQGFTGSETGEDTVTLFEDDDSDFRYDAPTGGMGGDQPSDTVSKTWVAEGQGTNQVRIDMETDPDSDNVDENGDCDGDRQEPIDEGGWNDRAQPNAVARDSAHKICAERFGPDDDPHVGPVTFTIVSGPGRFTDATGESDLGREYITGDDSDGYNVAYLNSIETGDTVVEASTNGASDSGTKPWFAPAGTARNITLSPDDATKEPGAEHELTARVTDKFGNPVDDVIVSFSEDGAGRFVEGGSSTTRQTDADGEATARTTTGPNETGEQLVTAALGANSTDCDQGANSPEQDDPAGNCSDTASVTWQVGDGNPDECEQEGVICGTEGDDTFTGTEGDDIIITFGGNDTVDGRGGNDLIRLGSGDDVAVGGPGDDVIRGGSGNDVIQGNGGKDILRGGSGNDTLTGGNKNDVIHGGSGSDVLRGNTGFDNLRGGKGRDTIRGGRGKDQVRGDRGHDSLFGNRGHDSITGGPGRDRCRGGAGRDSKRNCER